MPKHLTVSSSRRIVLAAIAATLLITGIAQASGRQDRQGTLTEEFHKVYPLSAQGRIEVSNLNGPVHITGWDRAEVKVDAVKSAWRKDRLDQATIEVDAGQDRISIHTQYADHDHTFNFGSDGEYDNPARVEYTITVPRQARLDGIKLVNGRLDIQDVTGEVRASCVNGRIHAQNLQGRAELSTVNGELEANVEQLSSSTLRLSSVNGMLRVTLPSDVNAEIEASTVSGGISDDFGMRVTHHQFVGHTLHGQLGGGGTLVKLSNVNGTIQIRHAGDSRPLSPAKNLERDRGRDSDDDKDDDKDED